MQIIQNLPPKFPDNTWVALDLELANAVKSKLHRPTTGEFACLTVCADPETVYIITDKDAINEALQGLSNCIWIFHNAKFDLIHLIRWAGIQHERIWDTMIVEQLLWSGYFGSFSLADLARRYLDIYLDKTLQDKWDEVDLHGIPQNYLEYAASDASTTLKVCMAQKKYVKQSHFDLWYKMELPVIWAVMGLQGFCVDVEKWLALSESNKTKGIEIDATLPINPRSPKQVREYLSKSGFRGIPSTGEDVLNQWIARKPDTDAAKVATQILESRMYSKRASTYGEKWVEEHVEYVDGLPMVFGNYHTIGAETGRFSCSNPNMTQIPARDTNEFRACFIARPGHKLIIVDYSQQEIGIAAYLSQDKHLKEIFNSGKDIYIQMAKLMYGVDIDKKDPLRKRMKSVVLGTNYGMSAYGLAKKEGITEDEAEDILKRVAKAFPGLTSWMNTQQRCKSKTTTVMGRVAWLNSYSGQCPRNALNNPIQGTASDMLKMAMVKIHQRLKDFPIHFPMVAAIHDELVLDVPEIWVEDVAKIVQDTMVEVANDMMPGMSFRASVAIGNNWSEKE